MLIYATTWGPTEGARKGDLVRLLRVTLRRVEQHVRRVDVRLISTGERPICSLHVTFTCSRALAIEEAAGSLSCAFDAAVTKLNEAIDSRLTGPFHGRRRGSTRSHRFGRREASTPSGRAKLMSSTLDGATQESSRGKSGHRVLVALPQLAYPKLFPARSKLLAAALASDLHVLKVLHALPDKSKVPRVRQGMNAERVLLGERKTRAWCKTVLGTQPPDAHVSVGIGDFVSEVVARAAALDAALIVLPHSGHEMGTIAVTLALGAFRPVLVARPLASRNTLLAALDLDDEHHPVLQAAEALAAELDAPVVALHNVDFDASSSSADGTLQTEYVAHPAQHARRTELSKGTTMLLTRDEDTARAIVSEARVHDVDTILVGARPPSWLDRMLGQDVVARLVDQVDRSVLIMPLASPEFGADFAASPNDLH